MSISSKLIDAHTEQAELDPAVIPEDRKTARGLGLKHYRSTITCPHGHRELRYVSTGICVTCHRQRALKVSRGDPERHRASVKSWRRANREKHLEYQKRWYRENTKKVKSRVRDNRYLLAPGQFERMLEQQQHRCLGCSETFSETPNVDHCHTTGTVRGLLCGHCNRSLAFARDNPRTLQNLARYVSKYQRESHDFFQAD